jgi:hypothetical protein
MELMADSNPTALPTARAFPDAVPILIDAEAEVTLRAAGPNDLKAIVEQCRDPEIPAARRRGVSCPDCRRLDQRSTTWLDD